MNRPVWCLSVGGGKGSTSVYGISFVFRINSYLSISFINPTQFTNCVSEYRGMQQTLVIQAVIGHLGINSRIFSVCRAEC